MNKLKQWIKKWRCIFFHDKGIRIIDIPNEKDLFLWGSDLYKGCDKCDIWRRL